MAVVVDVPVTAAVERPKSARRRGRQIVSALAVGWLVVVVVAAIGADWLPLPDPNAVEAKNALRPPSWSHWLGTDGLGRDQLSRLVHGARVSVMVSVSAVAVGLIVGGGLVAIAMLSGLLSLGVLKNSQPADLLR